MDNWTAITDNKLAQAIYLYDKINSENFRKEEKNSKDNIENLQLVCAEINLKIKDIYRYVQSTPNMDILYFNDLKNVARKLYRKMLVFDDQLKKLKSNRNEELEDFQDYLRFGILKPLEDPNNLQLHEIIKFVEDESFAKKEAIEPKKKLSDFLLNINDRQKFLTELKNTFITEKGKQFRILIELLQQKGLITIGSREFKSFYNSAKDFFCRDIGSYQSIKDKYNSDSTRYYSSDFTSIEERLRPIISKYTQTRI